MDPRADFDLAAARVEDATGQVAVFRPDDAPPPEPRIEELLKDGISLDDAVEVCLLNNRKIQAMLHEIGAARADVVQAGLLSNPTLSIGAGFPDQGGLANFQLALSQNLADLWQIPNRKQAAERDLDRTILTIAREVSVTVFDTKAAYFRGKQADRRREIAAESVQIAQAVLDLALARQQAGAGSEVDVNLARSEVQDAELASRAASLGAFEARSSLCLLLSLPVAPLSLDLTDVLPEPSDWNIADEAVLALAADHRLDVQAAVKAAEAAKARILSEELKLFPTLEVGVAFERDERRNSPGRDIPGDSLRASLDAGEPTVDIAPREESGGQDTIIGPTIGMELPIFNQNPGGIARARSGYDQSRKLLEELIVQVNQDVRLALARTRTAVDSARYYRDQVLPLREESLELARTAYQAGRTPLLNALEARRALLKAREGYADSLQASAGAVVELEKATGLRLPRLIEASQKPNEEQSRTLTSPQTSTSPGLQSGRPFEDEDASP